MALYTNTFKQFLHDYENSADWGYIINKFNTIPDFTIAGQSLDAYSLFKRRYLEREIGSETNEKFCRYIEMQLDVALIEYAPKIASCIANYNDLFNKVITETKGGTEQTDRTDVHSGSYGDSGSNDVSDYLNPSSSNADKIKDKTSSIFGNTRTFNDDTHTIDNDITYDITIEKELPITNVELLKQIQQVKSYYNEFIESFDICFMGLY